MNVLGHDGNTLGVDGAKVGVFEETDQVGLSSLLESEEGRRLESSGAYEFTSYFTDKSLEGELADEEVSRFLVTTDLTESDGTRAENTLLVKS